MARRRPSSRNRGVHRRRHGPGQSHPISLGVGQDRGHTRSPLAKHSRAAVSVVADPASVLEGRGRFRQPDGGCGSPIRRLPVYLDPTQSQARRTSSPRFGPTARYQTHAAGLSRWLCCHKRWEQCTLSSSYFVIFKLRELLCAHWLILAGVQCHTLSTRDWP